MYQFPDTTFKDGWRDAMCYKSSCGADGVMQLNILGQQVPCPSGQMVDLSKVRMSTCVCVWVGWVGGCWRGVFSGLVLWCRVERARTPVLWGGGVLGVGVQMNSTPPPPPHTHTPLCGTHQNTTSVRVLPPHPSPRAGHAQPVPAWHGGALPRQRRHVQHAVLQRVVCGRRHVRVGPLLLQPHVHGARVRQEAHAQRQLHDLQPRRGRRRRRRRVRGL
jgi:hypothetical protein